MSRHSSGWQVQVGVLGLTCALPSCGPPGQVEPCVPGAEPGDVLGVTLLEPYDQDTSFRFDPAAFGIGDEFGPRYANCDFERDVVLGERLVFDAHDRVGGSPGRRCGFLALGVRDTELIQAGEPALVASGTVGAEYLGVAVHYDATVAGCARGWMATIIVPRGEDPFASPATGSLPPALLSRDIAATDETCAYSDDTNGCALAVRVEKL